ncbi:MAG: BamA/TamA family outer membrane protein [Phocaeicola sp.]
MKIGDRWLAAILCITAGVMQAAEQQTSATEVAYSQQSVSKAEAETTQAAEPIQLTERGNQLEVVTAVHCNPTEEISTPKVSTNKLIQEVDPKEATPKEKESVTQATEVTSANESTEQKRTKRERNFRYSILGGPGYTPDFGFVIGGSLLSTFKTDPSDSTLLRSVMPLAFALTFGEKLGFNLMLNPQFYFKGDRFRLTGRIAVKNASDNYYGVGFEKNSTTERGTETTGYYLSQFQVNPVASFRIKETPLFVGPMVDWVYDKMGSVSPGVAADKEYQAQRGDSTGLSTMSTTVGLVASYDTRDVPANPYNGLFLELKAGYAPTFLGSDFGFGQLSLDYRQFRKMGERRTLAWTVNTKNTFGEVPIGRMPMVGSPFDLRGYYLGQYRDKSTSIALVEYRHMFNNDGETKWERLWRRVGFATWAGVGMMGPNLTKVDAVLPNFGAGLRIEVQPRMNFRLDIGYSTREKQTLMYFNMTEAF